MKVAVRYYTKTGNTKRLAEAVAKAVWTEALPISSPVTEPVDILFLGNSYYAFSIDPEVRDFVPSLDKNMVGKIVNFGSACMLNSTYKKRQIRLAFLWMSASFTAKANSKVFIKDGQMKKI